MTAATLTNPLDCQNVVAATVIEPELALKPLAEDLDGADYTIEPASTLTYYPTETVAMAACSAQAPSSRSGFRVGPSLGRV